MEWWFERNESHCGPVKKEDLQQMLSNNEIDRSTLVWCMSMREWAPANSVEELWLPPALPNKKTTQEDVLIPAEVALEQHKSGNNSTSDNEQVNFAPWRRYFAKHIDYTIFFALSAMTLPFIANSGSIENETVNSFFAKALVICALMSLFFECISMGLFGTTPGKLCLGINVRNINGSRLSLLESSERCAKIFFLNAFFLVPIIPFITATYQYKHLKIHGNTSYDDKGKYLVLVEKPEYGLLVLLVAFTIFLYSVVIKM